MSDKESWLFKGSSDDNARVLTWTFKDESERRRHNSMRRRLFVQWIPFGFIHMMSAVFLSGFLMDGRVSTPGLITLSVSIVMVLIWSSRRRHGLTSLMLELKPGSLKLTEIHGEPAFWRDNLIGVYASKHIKSAVWVSDGCWIELDHFYLTVRSVLLPVQLFADEMELEQFEAWMQLRGVELEGNRPLGVYERPVEEKRRL